MAILRNITNIFLSIIRCNSHSDSALPPLPSSIDLESQQPQSLPSPEVHQLASSSTPLSAAPYSVNDPQFLPQQPPPSAVDAASFQPPLRPTSNSESPQPAGPPSPLHSESLHSTPNLELSQPPEPPFPLQLESLQPPLPSIHNIESPQLPTQPPTSTIVDLESQQIIPDVAQQNLQWQNAILTFCFTSAIEISLQFAKSQSKLSLPFSLVSFAILLTFALLLIAKMISRELTKVSQVFENVAFLIAAATFCYTTTVPFPVSFKCVIWSIFAISSLILVIYKCFCNVAA